MAISKVDNSSLPFYISRDIHHEKKRIQLITFLVISIICFYVGTCCGSIGLFRHNITLTRCFYTCIPGLFFTALAWYSYVPPRSDRKFLPSQSSEIYSATHSHHIFTPSFQDLSQGVQNRNTNSQLKNIQKGKLVQLPFEILGIIFHFSSIVDVAAVGLTCKELQRSQHEYITQLFHLRRPLLSNILSTRLKVMSTKENHDREVESLGRVRKPRDMKKTKEIISLLQKRGHLHHLSLPLSDQYLTPLCAAAEDGNLDKVQLYIQNQVREITIHKDEDIYVYETGFSALYYAASYAHVSVVKYLLSLGDSLIDMKRMIHRRFIPKFHVFSYQPYLHEYQPYLYAYQIYHIDCAELSTEEKVLYRELNSVHWIINDYLNRDVVEASSPLASLMQRQTQCLELLLTYIDPKLLDYILNGEYDNSERKISLLQAAYEHGRTDLANVMICFGAKLS